MAKIVKCAFTSEWSDGSIVTTSCEYDSETGEVFPETSKGPVPTGTLEREYITLEDGEEIEVCMNCHGFVMKPVVVPAGHIDLVETYECSNPDCVEETNS